MKVELSAFQKKAVDDMRMKLAYELHMYIETSIHQVLSLQAPTGSGKTIMMASLIENVYAGCTTASGKTYIEQPNAIFIWLSDSPELNEQSKQKIELKTSKLHFGQCVKIDDSSFDCETLEDGTIYFLNTQKLTKSSNLTKHSDGRQYTIWETMNNTIRDKSDRLYFIIDEAHRGTKSKKESGTDTTIMQRFLKGYDYYEGQTPCRMEPMLIVIGMSATIARFNELVGNANTARMETLVAPEAVRSSGLLKDRIVVTYPDDTAKDNNIVLLEAAVEEWQKKCIRWHQYTYEQHYENVDPVFVIQVRPGSAEKISDTNLDDVLSKIEEKIGRKFKIGEVVHCFGSKSDLTVNGLTIPYVNASDIADNHNISVVLFKDALSTGWDCPRAETMMSFRTAKDATFIAQLLGRMVRTPLQMHVQRDDFLNDVKLYLPHFDKDTVNSVLDEFKDSEGGEIPTEINGQSLAEPSTSVWTSHRPPKAQISGQMNFFDPCDNPMPVSGDSGNSVKTSDFVFHQPEVSAAETFVVPVSTAPAVVVPEAKQIEGTQIKLVKEVDRDEIVKFINKRAYLTYEVRSERNNDYLKSLLDLAGLLSREAIDIDALDDVKSDIVNMIHDYAEGLRKSSTYDSLAKNIMQYKLSVQVFDAFGEALKALSLNEFMVTSDNDIDRQLRNANIRLGNFGVHNIYGCKYFDDDNPNQFKLDCILFAADDNCVDKLGNYAQNELNELSNKYRVKIVNRSDKVRNKYKNIMADSDIVSEQPFEVPDNVGSYCETPDGIKYTNHLLMDETTGYACIQLNGWEKELIEEESKRSDFA